MNKVILDDSNDVMATLVSNFPVESKYVIRQGTPDGAVFQVVSLTYDQMREIIIKTYRHHIGFSFYKRSLMIVSGMDQLEAHLNENVHEIKKIAEHDRSDGDSVEIKEELLKSMAAFLLVILKERQGDRDV